MLELIWFLLAILSAATATEQADRIAPPAPQEVEVVIPTEPCAEMNYYRELVGLPYRFSDQPRMPEVSFSQQGYGWREGNCRNDLVSSTGCCVGYWQIHTGNFTAPGYKAGIAACGVTRRSDILGNLPMQKYKQACVAKVLYDVSGLVPWRM